MGIKIILESGRHGRSQAPVSVPVPAGTREGAYIIKPGEIPAQVTNGTLLFISPHMRPGKSLSMQAEASDTSTPAYARSRRKAGDGLPLEAPVPAVSIAEEPGTLTFTEGNDLITRYHFGEGSDLPLPARPYFYPVNLNGLGLTRHITPKAEPQPRIDHPHHRSLWVAHGDVNGTDNWMEEPGHGFQKHVSFSRLSTSPGVVAGFEESLVWESSDGKKLLEETRAFKVWLGIAGGRFLDLDVTLKATFGPVTLGDTKEGGICAIRVHEQLQGDQTALMTTAFGGQAETEVWGYRSPWIDNSGIIDGKKVGISIFDHPTSFRHPTHWHARDYGLIGANPFAWHDYKTGWSQDGSYTIKEGESIPFKYRLFLHDGDCQSANVAAHWIDYAFPPKVKIEVV